MFFQLLAILAGLVIGSVSGLVPGMHTNTISAIISSMQASPELLALIIIGVLAGHTAFEFVPAIFFGAPDETTLISPLPGQRLFLEGRGLEALRICIFSLLLSTLISLAISPFALAAIPKLYATMRPFLAPLLVIGLLYLLALHAGFTKLESESVGGWATKPKFGFALFDTRVFALSASLLLISGLLGIVSLQGGLADPLFAIFAGLFAPGWLIFGAKTSKSRNPGAPINQPNTFPQLYFLPFVIAGVALGFFADLFPGMSSPAMIAGFALPFIPAALPEHFLALIASIVGSHTVFAFSSAASIGKGRVGAIEIARSLLPLDASAIPVFAAGYLAALGASAILLVVFSKKISKLAAFESANAKLAVFALLAFSVLAVNGPAGVAIFAVSLLVGCLPFVLGVSRIWLMGSLLLPTLAYLLGLA